MADFPTRLMGQRIDPSLLWYRKNIWDVGPARKEAELELEAKQEAHQATLGEFAQSDFEQNIGTVVGLNRKNQALRAIRLNQFAVNAEDADTLILRKKGAWGWMQSASGIGDIQVRLAGIDAPEVTSHSGDPLEDIRIWQNQPGGDAATEFLRRLTASPGDMSLVIDPTRKTYGRYLGVLAGSGGENVNLQLLEAGAVTALPFGPAEEDILNRRTAAASETVAREQGAGLWQYPRYQAMHIASKAIGRDITHNVMTQMDKMSRNLNLGAYGSFLADFGDQVGQLSPYEQAMAKRFGESLRKSHGPSPTGGNKFSGWDDAYNTIEGMAEVGLAAYARKLNTDFGSGFDVTKQIAKQLGLAWETMIRSPEFKGSLLKSKRLKTLGKGAFGRAILKETEFQGHKFQFVEKIVRQFPKQGSNITKEQLQQSLSTEKVALERLEGLDWFPSMYGERNRSVFMELMPGESFSALGAETFGGTVKSGFATPAQAMDLVKATKAASERGVYNLDIHRGNFLISGQGKRQRVSWIDFGLAHINPPSRTGALSAGAMERASMLTESTHPYRPLGDPWGYTAEEASAKEAVQEFVNRQRKWYQRKAKSWSDVERIISKPPMTKSATWKIQMAKKTRATQQQMFTAANGSSKTNTRPAGRRHTDLSCTPVLR